MLTHFCLSAFYNLCHCGCRSCSPVRTVQVLLSEADIACSCLCQSLFTASCVQLRRRSVCILQNNSTTWRETPWTEVFVLCEPFQSPLCVSNLMSLYVCCLKDSFFFKYSWLASLSLSAELQVCAGLEEARVAVFFHQGVDFGLGQIETGLAGMLHVLLCDGFGCMVKINLLWCIRADELVINFLGFGGQF